jgi:hypothetical protein
MGSAGFTPLGRVRLGARAWLLAMQWPVPLLLELLLLIERPQMRQVILYWGSEERSELKDVPLISASIFLWRSYFFSAQNIFF